MQQNSRFELLMIKMKSESAETEKSTGFLRSRKDFKAEYFRKRNIFIQ